MDGRRYFLKGVERPVLNCFTLLELVVAIAVMALTTALAVVSFRGESPVQQLNSAGLRFEAFCAKARFQAMENGGDRVVMFYPETRTFKMEIPAEFQAAEEAAQEEEENRLKLAAVEWTLPENFELGTAISDRERETAEESFEVFRFFPDGGASGSLRFELRYQTLRKVFDISPLTGLLMQSEEEAGK